ncbi:MAG: ester cyclase [Chloroflexi bacterium]|nr:ester cyclase [Chloroflexota bacterium]
MLRPETGRRQPLHGFDEDYVDIVDYIVRCTHKIWEERGIGLIYTHYNHNTPVYMSDGSLTFGREEVIANTVQSQAAFPDHRGFAEDVVWGGNDREGFLSSHRVMGVGRNTGYTKYGPPTGRKVRTWVIANCLVRENHIIAEWLYHNELSFIRQLGLPIRETVLRHAPRRLDSLGPEPRGEVERVPGQDIPPSFGPRPVGFDLEDMVRRSLHEIWNWRLLNRIEEYYAPNYLFHGATDREYYGRGNYTAYVLSMLAMFPDAALFVDDLRWVGNRRDGYRTAVRWSLLGTHTGPGVYGEPTGRQVRMHGVTQHRVREGRFVEEWTVFNELEIVQQLWCDR